MSADFAALRSVANGTKRTSRDDLPFVRYRSEADMRCRLALALVALTH
jgi:hypothetical protein